MLFLSGLVCSCGQGQADLPDDVLPVTVKPQPLAWQNLFSRMEAIPLETNDSCLLMHVAKVVSYDDSLYVFDDRRPALYVFGANGCFVRQISGIGQGPGEYTSLVDFAIDRGRKEIVLLAPFGYCLVFGMNGGYMREVTLPVKPNYQSLAVLSDGNYALWSCVESEEEGITVADTAGDYQTGYWHNDRILDSQQLKPFYEYDGKVFFATAFTHPVYEVATDTLRPSYLWDFGGQNVDAHRLEPYLEIENPSERNNRLLRALEAGTLPFLKEAHYENNRYRYVALRPGFGPDRPWINVFYDKQKGKTFVFEDVREGFPVRPLQLTDTYVLSLLQATDMHHLKDILPAEEYAKLSALDEESNPCLLRMYFK